MKETVKTSRTAGYLEKIFRAWRTGRNFDVVGSKVRTDTAIVKEVAKAGKVSA